MRISRTLLAVLACIATTAGAMAATGNMMSAAKPAPLKITLNAQNGSKESGFATLTQKGPNVVVVISLKNAKGSQPAHIHAGSCAKLNPAPKYMLNNVVNGKSTSTVKGVTLASLLGSTAINVHKSAADLKDYVSCGDIAK